MGTPDECLPDGLVIDKRYNRVTISWPAAASAATGQGTIGFEVSSPRISVNEQRVQDVAIGNRLHEFFRSLLGDRFPTLIALGEHVWLDNRDERFVAGINALVDGLERAQRPSSPS